MEKKYVVGIDCGTTSTKTVIFDFEGNQIGVGQHLNPLTYPSQGRVECDGPAMIENLYRTTRDALADAKIDPEEIAAISCTMFRCTAITRDADGGFTTPIIIWQDLRGVEMVPEMDQMLKDAGLSADDLYDMSGMPLAGTYPLAKLLWVKKYNPEAYEKATRIHTMMGLLNKAYGADDYYDDYSDTPWIQLNGEDFNYSQKLCDAFGVDKNKLAPLAQTGTKIGEVTPEVAEKTGLAVGTPLIMGTGDQQIACLGCGCVDEGIGFACGGTAGITAGKSMKILRDPDRKCYVLGTPDGAYVMEGQSNSAASAFKWFKDTIAHGEAQAAVHTHGNAYDILTHAASFSKPGANGVFFLPYMQGANTPNYDLNARGTYTGMTLATTREDIIRATMEGIVFDLKDMLLAMLDAKVPPFNTVRITGGIAVSEIWNQMQADIYNWNVETVAVSEATALGCALVAAVGAGIYPTYKEAVNKMVKVVKRYTPNQENVPLYEDAFKVWRQIFRDLHQNSTQMIADFQDKYR